MQEIKFYNLDFVDKRCEYNSIYTFRFRPQEKIEFTAGQWVHLGFPTEQKDKTKVRHMSFASSPDKEFVEFSMDLSSNTAFKHGMSQLKPGSVMRAFKIKGDFIVDTVKQKDVVFISGGIGITPVRSIVDDLEKKASKIKWSLIHVSRDQFLYEDELKRFTNLQFRVRRAELEGVWDKVVDSTIDRYYYVSGSDNFVKGMLEKLNTSNVPEEKIIVEDFN